MVYVLGRQYVYVVAQEGGYTKIGRTDDVDTRLRQLQTGNPHKLRTVFKQSCSTEIAKKIEKSTLRSLTYYSVLGGKEWFNINFDEVIKLIMAIMKTFGQPRFSIMGSGSYIYIYIPRKDDIRGSECVASLHYGNCWEFLPEVLWNHYFGKHGLIKFDTVCEAFDFVENTLISQSR